MEFRPSTKKDYAYFIISNEKRKEIAEKAKEQLNNKFRILSSNSLKHDKK